MTRVKDMPASSFGANLHEVLRKGANKELVLNFPTSALAVRFRHRINALRSAMKREKHPDWKQLYRCGVYVDPARPNTLIIAPRDSEFNDVLKKAGVETDSLERIEYSIPVSATPFDKPDPYDPAESFLATLREATTVPPRRTEPDPEPEPDPDPDLDKL